ncbi:MAG: DUF3098 domain-containing protein [Algoriphagus sp.]|jgi:hypothetical protein|nr:DUF3098 domain-containing protein [Algoriphagus sp.]MCE2779285.1 DUF3098 domain-containing protein [Algoriphagus sp.]
MSNSSFPFSKKNYLFLFLGLGLIVLGFIIMGMDSTPHGSGFMGLTLGPIITLSGFVLEFYAIFAKSSKS